MKRMEEELVKVRKWTEEDWVVVGGRESLSGAAKRFSPKGKEVFVPLGMKKMKPRKSWNKGLVVKKMEGRR